MKMRPQDITIIKREVQAVIIPYGENVTLMPGTEALVTQDKGNSYTLNVNGNLLRIDGQDADAIGRTPAKNTLPKEDLTIEQVDQDLIYRYLKSCYDPEIPVNIVDLGLIYQVSTERLKKGGLYVGIQMTLTAAGCGMGPVIVADVEQVILALPHVKQVDVVLVFDPPWNADMMSEEARLELGLL